MTMTSSQTSPPPVATPAFTFDDTPTGAPAGDTAADLLNQMAAMPAGHPSRPALRDRAIEAWLPLARHLARRYAGRGEPTNDLIQTANVDIRATLGPALDSLGDRERKIVILRFYGNLTQSQIAEQVGVSQMHVSRLLTKALAALRVQISTDDI